MRTENHNIVIIGAGPAGATASAFLCKNRTEHLVIDKHFFPRDKICGDALSGKVIPVLKKLDPEMIRQIADDPSHFTGSYGIKFAAPNGKSIDVPFNKDLASLKVPPGFISKRIDFDHFLVKKIDASVADFRQGHELISATNENAGMKLEISDGLEKYSVNAKLVIAADGERSIIAKQIAGHKKLPDHNCAGIRAYYRNVSGMHPRNFIELHFLEELLPGYFWIFPLPGGFANVGAGMLSSSVSRKKINLREAMLGVIKNNPTIRDRFTGATLQGKIEGWGLPLGSKKRTLSGDHYLLTGDAGSMIDPFTGEGISNAMYCGMMAAETAVAAISESRFDSKFLFSYDEKVYRRLWNELKLSHTMQKLCKYPWLFNFVINKAERNRTFRETISCMFDDLDLRARFRDPSFYVKMLFRH